VLQLPARIFMFAADDAADEASADPQLLAHLPCDTGAPQQAILPEHLIIGAIWLASVALGAWRLWH